MSVLKYFKNTPRSPPIGRQALSVFFFFKFATRSLAKKRACRPPQRAIGACRPPQGRQGPVARWGGDRGLSPVGGRQGPSLLYKPWPPFAVILFVI